MLFAHLEESPPTLPGLEEVLPKALAKEPEPSATQTGHELSKPPAGRSGSPSRSAAAGRSPSPRSASPSIAAALAAFFLTRSDGGGTASAPGGRLVRIDPVSNGVERSVAVGDGPEAVAAGSGHVWVASFLDGTLWQVDPRSGGPTRIAAVGRPFAVTIADGSAYVAASGPGQFTGNVSKFDAVTGDRGGGLQGVFCSLASGAYGVWVAGCPNVQKLSTEGATPRIRRERA